MLCQSRWRRRGYAALGSAGEQVPHLKKVHQTQPRQHPRHRRQNSSGMETVMTVTAVMTAETVARDEPAARS